MTDIYPIKSIKKNKNKNTLCYSVSPLLSLGVVCSMAASLQPGFHSLSIIFVIPLDILHWITCLLKWDDQTGVTYASLGICFSYISFHYLHIHALQEILISKGK